MLIILKPIGNEAANSVKHWARANAVIDPTEFDPAKTDQRPVDAFSMALTTTEGLAEPGVLPILVKRFDPKDESGVGALRSRFSMLAYDVIINGQLKISARKSLAVGPTRSKNDPDEEKLEADFLQGRNGSSLFYRLALPVWKLLKQQDSDPYPNAYVAIGVEVTVNGMWRDVYGNDLPFQLLPALSQTFRVPYSDRVIPLNDAPGLVFGWWPAGKPGEILLAIGFDASNRFERLVTAATGGAVLTRLVITADHICAMQRALDRDTTLLKRLAYQLEDTRVRLVVKTSLWVDGAARKWSQDEKMRLVGLVRRFLDLCDGYAQAIGTIIGQPASNLLDLAEEKIRSVKKPTGEKKALSLILTCGGVIIDHEAFVEVSTSLTIERTLPEGDKANTPDDVKHSVMPVLLPLRSDDDKTDTFGSPFGRTINDFSDAIKKTVDVSGVGPRYCCATGYSDTPGLTERAIWLVRSDYIPRSVWEQSTPRFLALPPVSVRLHSFDLEVRLFDPTSDEEKVGKTSVHGVDADDLTRRALDRLDAALSGSVVAATVGAAGGDTALREVNRDAIQQLLEVKDAVAHELEARLTPVLEDDNAFVTQPMKDAIKDALSDRFKKRLGAIYDVDTIVIYRDMESDENAPVNPDQPLPSAYGSIIQQSDAGGDGSPKSSFESFAVRIGPDRKALSRMLVIACDAPPNYGEAMLAPPMMFQITHIQRKNRLDRSSSKLGEPGRYRPTAWLKLVQPVTCKLPTSRKIPIVLRSYPTPPGIEKDDFTPAPPITGGSFRDRLRTACSWTARTIWKWSSAPQDRLEITLAYNPPKQTTQAFKVSIGSESELSSFEKKVLERAMSLPEIDIRMAFGFATFVMETESASLLLETLTDASSRSRALSHIAKAACLLKRILKLSAAFALSVGPKPRSDILSIKESSSEGRRTVTVNLHQSETKAPITLTILDKKPTGTDNEKELAKLTVSTLNSPGTIKLTDDKNEPRRRRLEVTGLNILSLRRFETQLKLTRNRDVLVEGPKPPVSINTEFIYKLPTITSFEPVAPKIHRDIEILFDNSPKGIHGHVACLIDGLVGELADQPEILAELVCDLAVSFEPEIVKGMKSYGGKCIKVVPDFPLSPPSRNQVVVTLADVVKGWLTEQQPYGWGTKNPQGSLVFDVKIYERAMNQLILRLQRCVLPLKLVTLA